MCKEGFDVICEQQVFDCHQYHENEGDELVSHLKGHHLNESSVFTVTQISEKQIMTNYLPTCREKSLTIRVVQIFMEKLFHQYCCFRSTFIAVFLV